jgi:hypothetical protein
MEISDDDRPLQSSASSCLQTHPPPHQEAHDFLSSLLLTPEGEGVWPGEGTVDGEGAGVCPLGLELNPLVPSGNLGYPNRARVGSAERTRLGDGGGSSC